MGTQLQDKTIAVFDFDGTITTKDTLFDFTQFYHGKLKFVLGFAILSPVLILYKLRIISAEKAKQKFISFFFKGESIHKLNTICTDYRLRINTILNPAAIDKIKWHQQQEHLVIINSASAENWIKPWADSMGINTVISTKLEIQNEKLSGRFVGENCNGIQKVIRFKELFPDTDNYAIYVYGDSSGDKELLAIADYPFYRRF